MYDSLWILCAKRNCPLKASTSLNRSCLDRNSPRDFVSKKSLSFFQCWLTFVQLGIWSRVWGWEKRHIFMTSSIQYPPEAKKAVACLRRWSRYCTCCRVDWHKGARIENQTPPQEGMLYVLKQNLPHGAIQTESLYIRELHLSTIRKETPRGHVEPCYAMNLNTRRYPEYMIFLRHTRSLSNINIYRYIIIFHFSCCSWTQV